MAASFAIGVGATSKAADRLEHQGWSRRVPHPSDRRSSLLALTPLGFELVAAAERTFTDYASELIDGAVSSAQLVAAIDALSARRTALERDHLGVPAG